MVLPDANLMASGLAAAPCVTHSQAKAIVRSPSLPFFGTRKDGNRVTTMRLDHDSEAASRGFLASRFNSTMQRETRGQSLILRVSVARTTWLSAAWISSISESAEPVDTCCIPHRRTRYPRLLSDLLFENRCLPRHVADTPAASHIAVAGELQSYSLSVATAGTPHHLIKHGIWARRWSSDPSECKDLRRHTRTGRPLGSGLFVDRLEQPTGRSLPPRKRGPEPAN